MAGAVLSAFLIWQVGSVAFRTVAGTATAGLDFVATEGYVNFAAGQTVAEVSVTIIDDDEPGVLSFAEDDFYVRRGAAGVCDTTTSVGKKQMSALLGWCCTGFVQMKPPQYHPSS